eukprot:394098_1
MTNPYSQLLWTYAIESIGAAIFYHIILWKIYVYCENELKSLPKKCLQMGSTTISTIHSFIFCISLYDFFANKRWEKPIFDEPKLIGHIWAIGIGYFVADLLAYIVCILIYDKNIIPRRWDIIIHHVIIIAAWFLWEWPKPIHAWYCASIFPAMEISTIFLNFQWFGKLFKKKRLEKISKRLFFISWFVVRVPISVYGIRWLIKYNEQIQQEYPPYLYIFTVIPFGLFFTLIAIWTIVIVWKLLYPFVKDKTNMPPEPPQYLHGMSVEV